MSYYTQLLRMRVRQALTSLLEGAHRARDLAGALRELASELHVPLPFDLHAQKAEEEMASLRKRVRQALTSLLAVERTHFARELATILRELADELDQAGGPPGGDGSGSDSS
jgi:hypothetical protein